MVAIPRLVLIGFEPERSVYGNSESLLALADNFAYGKGYLDEAGLPDSYFNPGYPAFLALCRRISDRTLWPIKIGQVGLDVATAAVLCWLLSKSFAPLVALLFAFAFALHPLFLHLANNVTDEILLTFLVAASFVMMHEALKRQSVWRFAWAGLLTGLATYTKTTPILLPPFLVASLWLGRRGSGRLSPSPRHLIAYFGVFALVLCPWVYRNYHAFGRLTFGGRGIGSHLEWGADPRIFMSYGPAQRVAVRNLEKEMESRGIPPLPERYNIFERESYRLRIAAEVYRELSKRPFRLLHLIGLKVARTLFATENRPDVHVYIIAVQLPTVVLGVIGFSTLCREQGTRLMGMLMIAYCSYFYLVVAAGMPMLRYFAPAMPLLLAGAAIAVGNALAKRGPC